MAQEFPHEHFCDHFLLSQGFASSFSFYPERSSRDTSESSRDRQCDVRIAGQRVGTSLRCDNS